MPFTCSPSKIARDDPRQIAIDQAAADDSFDARQHLNSAIKRPCPVCPALINERCHAETAPSGAARYYLPHFHPERAR